MEKVRPLAVLLGRTLPTRPINFSRLASSKSNIFNTISLSEPLPGYEKVVCIDNKTVKLYNAKITKLESGLTVVTEPAFGEYCTLGVAINAGPRYETHYPWGVSHFIEKLAFNTSENFTDRAHTFQLIEDCGALVDCQSTKDTFMYAASCRTESTGEMTRLIADTVLRPLIDLEEVRFTSDVIRFENEANIRKPEPVELLIDWVHEAGFKGNTIGIPKYCSNEEVEKIGRRDILSYMSQYFRPDRMVLGGIGVDHDFLVSLGKQFLDPTDTTWGKHPSQLHKDLPVVDKSLAQYTGGIFKLEKDLSQVSLGPTPFPNLAHLMIGFESVSTSHPDFVAFCVLQSLLGGGGSFSAGGPGKGMFSRLYADVMYRYHWFYNATSFNFSYMDTGIFAVRASAPPENLHQAAIVIMEEFLRLTKSDVATEELARAKIQLKSQLLMNLEIKPVMFEDMTRQVLNHGHRKHPQQYLEEIDKVTPKDINRVAQRMLLSKPSIVGYGDLQRLQSYERFDQAVAQRSVKTLSD
ncbi:unnamed protein product [Bursaphelenchus xylophilus]|uniref:Alpha-MPP n=1 Tax=Bursaphelenchus xylophilus TaxID=6326 RepID=A0A1I7SLY5_BURXY|nr:unnamed protein product [Bursaphelenchus xylophilus]CAG9129927.1 unnamed protein product [Bursaphelenchus xylophilus]